MATALKLARVTAGWSQTQVLARMRQAAAELGEELPGRASLRVQLSQWENGHRRPCEFYRRVFCEVYHRPPEHLGFPTTTDAVPGGIIADVVAALLTTEALRAVPPARVRLYTAIAAADPHTPALTELAAGLRQARAHPPAWLDRDRLHVCDTAAHQADTHPATTTPGPAAGRVPDWVTTGRLTSSVTAATALTTPSTPFTNPPFTNRPPAPVTNAFTNPLTRTSPTPPPPHPDRRPGHAHHPDPAERAGTAGSPGAVSGPARTARPEGRRST